MKTQKNYDNIQASKKFIISSYQKRLQNVLKRALSLCYITILFSFLFTIFFISFMMDKTPMRKDLIGENQIEEILFKAVNLFKKTGLTDLAEKWDKILKMYVGKKDLT